jgi:hypothetical protein
MGTPRVGHGEVEHNISAPPLRREVGCGRADERGVVT